MIVKRQSSGQLGEQRHHGESFSIDTWDSDHETGKETLRCRYRRPKTRQRNSERKKQWRVVGKVQEVQNP